MTFRLCLVGNSHIGALKRAWKIIQTDFPDLSVTMYGAPGRMFAALQVGDGRIVARSEEAAASLMATGGSDRIVLADHDALVVVGGNTRLYTIAGLMRTYRPAFMNRELVDATDMADRAEKLARLKSFYRKSNPASVSNSLFREIMRGANAQSAAVRLIADIARQGAPRLLGHVATPFPSSSLLTTKPKHVACRIVDLGYGHAFADIVQSTLEEVLTPAVRLIRPPDKVLVGGLMTDRRYSDGSIRLHEDEGEHEENDVFHMNAAYGEIMLRQVIAEMRA